MRLRRSGLRDKRRRPAVMSQTYWRLMSSSSASRVDETPDWLIALFSSSGSIEGTHAIYACLCVLSTPRGSTHLVPTEPTQGQRAIAYLPVRNG